MRFPMAIAPNIGSTSPEDVQYAPQPHIDVLLWRQYGMPVYANDSWDVAMSVGEVPNAPVPHTLYTDIFPSEV
jgi:hypothetical protein